MFFYVDDIIVAFYQERRTEVKQAVELPKEKYTMTGGDDLR